MKHLVYVSQARAPMTDEELRELLEHSRKRNLADGITGLLIYRYSPEFSRGNFLQVLEGPAAALDDVWERISKDRRHHTIVVLEESGDPPERMFADWSMGFKNVQDDDLRGVTGFADMGSDAFWDRAARDTLPSALEFLSTFYDAG